MSTDIKKIDKFQEFIDLSYLGLGDTAKYNLSTNPLLQWQEGDNQNPLKKILTVMMNPKYFHFTCKHLLNIDLAPFQVAILWELWNKPYPCFIGTRAAGKTFLLAVYALLKALLVPGSKIIFAGSAFRQSKLLFEAAEKIYYNSPVLRDIVQTYNPSDQRAGPRRDIDRVEFRVCDSIITGIPVGDGQTIRGLRATCLIVDEFSAIQKEIYEVVMQGFIAVKASPIEGMKDAAKKRILRNLNIPEEILEATYGSVNQSIISGTADIDYSNFADYWKQYKRIIESRGDKRVMEEIYNGEPPPGISYKDFSIIRIPYDLIPEGFMEEKAIARAKATMNVGTYKSEYLCVFQKDTDGFFRRRLLDSCTVGNHQSPIFIGDVEVDFLPTLRGSPFCEYVMGIDPASEVNNLAIVIVELQNNHRRIVYCWTTNKKAHREKLRRGTTSENDYYSFCARKVRDLMRLFKIRRIAIDPLGGGYAIMESLHNVNNLKEGEIPLWPVIIEGKEQPTDFYAGDHIIELANFSSANWCSEANHGMKKDFEDKRLLFPKYDAILLEMAAKEDVESGRVKIIDNEYVSIEDTFEDCTLEIEALKQELQIIIHTRTAVAGREHWDSPEIKLSNSKKGRMQKDRYSALLIANMCARQLQTSYAEIPYQAVGGAAHTIGSRLNRTDGYESLYRSGPEWFMKGLPNSQHIGKAIRRGR